MANPFPHVEYVMNEMSKGRARLSSARREPAKSSEVATMRRAEDRRALPSELCKLGSQVELVAVSVCMFLMLLLSDTTSSAAEKLKVMIVTGGHGFEKEPFFKMFENNSEISFTTASHSGANASVYERDDLLSYDVAVLYDMPKEINESQKQNFLSLFDKGIGVVVLHHALVSYPNWPEYEKIIGGHYSEPDPKRPGTVTEQAGYQHDVDIPVVIVAKNHPVTAGLNDFMINDEIYWGFQVRPGVTTLITTTHPKSGKPLGWTRMQGKSRLVYLQLGHGPSAFNDPNYRKLLAQSIRWTAKRGE
jgi:type 1 glutamine amidotransferase